MRTMTIGELEKKYFPRLTYETRPAPWWARLLMTKDATAITLGHTIYFKEPERWSIDNLPILAHELVHVRQWTEIGATKFVAQYLWYHLTRGYWANPFEEEAYNFQLKITRELPT